MPGLQMVFRMGRCCLNLSTLFLTVSATRRGPAWSLNCLVSLYMVLHMSPTSFSISSEFRFWKGPRTNNKLSDYLSYWLFEFREINRECGSASLYDREIKIDHIILCLTLEDKIFKKKKKKEIMNVILVHKSKWGKKNLKTQVSKDNSTQILKCSLKPSN